ncbi:MAG: tripartite tricarboxylate transporter substrate binding protein [Gammaproteobacteria bacterium]|nr:tripartite tricarboxylate transporter substrate binding protein [Gammaproteobacteria bacterium]
MKFSKNLVMALTVGVLIAIAVITDIQDVSVSSANLEIFPRHSVEMVIPFGTGGASDIFARQYSQIVSRYLGESLVAINKSGAGTIEGLLYAVNAPADGYTILEITPSLLIVEAQNKSSVKFRTEFEPLLKIQNDIVLFGVADNSPHNTVEELLTFARENPGNLKIGGLSPGGLDNYIASAFAEAAGIEWTYVPYKSGAELKAAILGGELDVYQDKLISFMGLVSSGDVRPLVVLNDKRLDVPGLQDVPGSVEKGINFTQGSWRGFSIRKDTPLEIKNVLIEAFQKAYDDPQYKEMEEREMTNLVPGYMEAGEFSNSWDAEYENFATIFKELGLVNQQ